jgi:hypothetical protein
MFFPVEEWFAAFVLTLVVETPIVVAVLRRREPDLVRLALIAVIANLATHPAVWFVFTQLFLVGTREYVLAAEVWAVGIEASVYLVVIRGVGARRAVTASVLANGASIVAGLMAGGQLMRFPT